MKSLPLITSLCVLFAGSIAFADWDPGDGHKMHFPQLPDPLGWDVAFSSPGVANGTLADDWQCSQTGPVDDIHFWISVRDSGPSIIPPVLQPFRVLIREDVPAGTIPGIDYSTPGNILWTKNVDPTDPSYNIRWYGSGDQGWYDPWTGVANPSDHTEFFQINLTGLDTAADPAFVQTAGTIYWLEVGMLDAYDIGWKTADLNSYPPPFTGQHFMDDAVYSTAAGPKELYYPNTTPPESLDLAFVITPEPATIALLGLGSLTLLRRKRKV